MESRLVGAGVDEIHEAGHDFAGAAGLGVGREVGGKASLELKGKALPHDAYAVDGIYEGLAAGGEDIALGEADHWGLL